MATSLCDVFLDIIRKMHIQQCEVHYVLKYGLGVKIIYKYMMSKKHGDVVSEKACGRKCQKSIQSTRSMLTLHENKMS